MSALSPGTDPNPSHCLVWGTSVISALGREEQWDEEFEANLARQRVAGYPVLPNGTPVSKKKKKKKA
jgi:hypothetical protein